MMFKDHGCGFFPPDKDPNCGIYPPDREPPTLTEAAACASHEVKAIVKRLMDFEERLKADCECLLSTVSHDNVIFKTTFNECYQEFTNSILEKVQGIEDTTATDIALFVEETTAKLEAAKAELNEICTDFTTALERRVEQNTASCEATVNSALTTLTGKITAAEKRLLDDYTEFTATTDAKLTAQDDQVADAVHYLKTNLNGYIEDIIQVMEENEELVGILDSDLFIIPKHQGATGDGATDDSVAIQAMFTSATPSFEAGGYGDTASQVGTKVYFPKGKYRITRPINITNKFLNIDFGEAIFVKDFTGGYLFNFTAYRNNVTGGVFCGDNIFKVTNNNEDQGIITFEHMEFKGCEVAFDVGVQSSKITISKCKFDNCVHPYIGFTDGGTIEDCWMTCPVPATDDSNIRLTGGHMYFHNNLLVPVVGDLNGTETAWIDNNQRSLICENNRFGGEDGCRTAVNHKYKFTNDVVTTLIFNKNLVQAQRDEKSAIRLFTLPNTFVMRDNYCGALMTYGVSITRKETDAFDADLAEVYGMYTSLQINENPFGYPKYRKFRYEVENNFYNTKTDTDMEIERETELWFLLGNYSKIDRLNEKCSFGFPYKAQALTDNGTDSLKSYYLPIYMTGANRICVRFNPNVSGSASYSVNKIYTVYKAYYYDEAEAYSRNRFIVEDENGDIYPEDINNMVSIGIHNGQGTIYTGENATNMGSFLGVRISATDIGNVRITCTPL